MPLPRPIRRSATLDGNLALIRRWRAEAAAAGADLVVFSELVVVGYPPEDLVLKPALQDAVRRAVEALAADTADGGPALIVGAPWRMAASSTTPCCCCTPAGS